MLVDHLQGFLAVGRFRDDFEVVLTFERQAVHESDVLGVIDDHHPVSDRALGWVHPCTSRPVRTGSGTCTRIRCRYVRLTWWVRLGTSALIHNIEARLVGH